MADGCGESKFSEFGVIMAYWYFKKCAALRELECGAYMDTPHLSHMFNHIASRFDLTTKPTALDQINLDFIRECLLFTTLLLFETQDTFEAETIGDGFLILIDHNDKITFEELAPTEKYVPFFAYDFIPETRLSTHKDPIEIKKYSFSKSQYKCVGLASDGLRFYFKLPPLLQEEFLKLLIKGKEVPVKLFINRNYSYFQDDITIVL